VEFKKPNNYRGGRTQIAVPERRNSTYTPHDYATHKKITQSAPGQGRRLWANKKAVTISAIALAVVCIMTLNTFVHQHQTVKNDAAHISSETPSYSTVLPSGKTADQLGGWKRVSPPQTDPVYAYTDKIGDITISVSQQPLPKSFQGDANDQVADLAKKFNATNKINADGTDLYVGTSAQGPQSAILTKKSLLILIKSQKKVDDKAWANYAKSLS
jgi:hypothetical protein